MNKFQIALVLAVSFMGLLSEIVVADNTTDSKGNRWKKPPVGDFDLRDHSKPPIIDDGVVIHPFREAPTGHSSPNSARKFRGKGLLIIDRTQERLYPSNEHVQKAGSEKYFVLDIDSKELMLVPLKRDRARFTACSQHSKLQYFNKKVVMLEGLLDNSGILHVDRISLPESSD